MASFELAWDAPEFEYREKDVSWYWVSIITAALFIAFAVWFRNFLFGFFIVVAEILFIVWGNRAPRLIAFKIDDQGLAIDDSKFYGFKEFEAWSSETQNDDWTELYLYFRSSVKPALKVLFPTEKIADLRLNFKPVLKEIEHQPSLLDAIEKFLRF